MHRLLPFRSAVGAVPRRVRRAIVIASSVLVLGWGGFARASESKCPRAGGAYINLLFSGTAWSPAQQESIVRALRSS